MKKIDRKTEKYLRELLEKIEVPDFQKLFGRYATTTKTARKNSGFFGNVQVSKILPSFLCVMLIILSTVLLSNIGVKDVPGSGNGEVPPIEEPEISYYLKQLEQVKISLTNANSIGNSKGYILPVLDDKEEVLIYKVVINLEHETILGLNISFMLMNDSMMYTGSVLIIDNIVKDAMDHLPHDFNVFQHNEIIFNYSYPNFDGTWYSYNAWFVTESTNYIIVYQSALEDIEQGIMTIF